MQSTQIQWQLRVLPAVNISFQTVWVTDLKVHSWDRQV